MSTYKIKKNNNLSLIVNIRIIKVKCKQQPSSAHHIYNVLTLQNQRKNNTPTTLATNGEPKQMTTHEKHATSMPKY